MGNYQWNGSHFPYSLVGYVFCFSHNLVSTAHVSLVCCTLFFHMNDVINTSSIY